jgi:hypothetical protein
VSTVFTACGSAEHPTDLSTVYATCLISIDAAYRTTIVAAVCSAYVDSIYFSIESAHECTQQQAVQST